MNKASTSQVELTLRIISVKEIVLVWKNIFEWFFVNWLQKSTKFRVKSESLV